MAKNRAVNKTVDAIVISVAPDVCKTPVGGSVVPVPYPIIAKFDSAQAVSPNVNFEDEPVFHMGSHLPQVIGDEAGVVGGIKSSVNKGFVAPNEHSSTLRTNNQWVVRHGDLMEMNCATCQGPGNTKGKILYFHLMQEARIDPATGDIEYFEREETVDKDGNRHVKETKITQGADGTLKEVDVTEGVQDAAGNSSIKHANYDFEGAAEGAGPNITLDQQENFAPFNPEGVNPEFPNQSPGYEPYYPESDFPESQPDFPSQPPPSPEVPEPPISLPDDHPDILNDPDYQAALRDQQAADAAIEGITTEQALDAAQLALDVAGIADPTPASDGAAAILSASRGDWLGAGLSVLSFIPYAGDAVAKPFKGARAAAKATKLANKLNKARKRVAKAKEAAEQALKRAKKKAEDALEAARKKKKKKPDADPPPKKKPEGKDGGKIKGKPSDPDGPVRPGDEGTYGDLKKRKKAEGETEPMDIDHRPSYAAQKKALEDKLGRELSPAEAKNLKNQTPAVATPRKAHQQQSRTYGGRNNKAKIAEDAKDLDRARILDDKAMGDIK